MSLWIAGLLVSVVSFPKLPIESEMARGERIYRQKKGIERTLLEDRNTLGGWFDGIRKVELNQAIRLSPAMMSRWLGYLNVKEKWTIREVQARWNSLARNFAGSSAFVVELYALPKQSDYFEITDWAPTRPETAVNVRFLMTIPRSQGAQMSDHKDQSGAYMRIEPSVTCLEIFRGFSVDAIRRFPWFTLDPSLAALTPEFAIVPRSAYEAVTGDYVRAVYLIEGEVPPESRHLPISLHVFAPGKELRAAFKVL